MTTVRHQLDVLSAEPLTGRTAVVTGGGRGIGAGISALLARAGARVALVGRDEQTLKATADQLPHDPLVVPIDLTAPDAADAVLSAVLDAFGRLDVLVNNAGGANYTPSQQLTAAEVDTLLTLNVRTPLLLAAKAAATMASTGGGSIVNISSVIGEHGLPGSSLYGASKSGVDGVTRALAAEWGPHGVRVNAIRPGVTRSDMSGIIFSDPQVVSKMAAADYPLRRLGEPEDIANGVLFLASDASSFVTGQIIAIDGGWSATRPPLIG
jgi:NAD(P)-dependent dehydrogenase (short-subunit alcohol dehydrogenase family)